tara:strand:+ start:124 stop:357 length:234 start_codon:yes stop_codon:yes gene_type:complete
MKTETTKDILAELTVHMTRISGDVEHIREKVNEINEHLVRLNGRVTEAEKQISSMKGIGGTLVFVIGSILTWLGIEK